MHTQTFYDVVVDYTIIICIRYDKKMLICELSGDIRKYESNENSLR